MGPTREGVCYRWDAPDGSASVALDGEVVEQLQSQVMEAFHSLPKRGAEAGGLLLGKIENTEPLTFRVEGFEAISCEHRYGASYILSKNDRVNLTRALERRSPHGSVVGFYRSYTGREPALDAADEELIRTCFSTGHYAFLLIHPDTPHGCLGTFLFCKDGKLLAQPRYAPFPLRAEEAPPVRHPAPGPSAARPAEPVLPEPPTPRPRFWLPLLLLVAASIGSVFVYDLWRVAREPRWVPLELNANLATGGLEVSWNRSAPEVLRASRGVLSVADGASRKDVELNPAEIQSGKLFYQTSRENVLLRLSLYGSGIKPAGDSVRIVNLPMPAPPPSEPRPEAPKPAEPPVTETTTAQTPNAAAVPPTVVREVNPAIPDGIRSRIPERMVVPIEVRVNESGRVTKAASQVDGDGLYRYLANRAVKAAYRWRFTPGRTMKGKRIAATKTIYFVFTR